jgi:hypothetical protein
MTHKHTESTSRNLPFGGVTLYTCTCGARKMSSGSAIVGGQLDTDGWYAANKVDESRPSRARGLKQTVQGGTK